MLTLETVYLDLSKRYPDDNAGSLLEKHQEAFMIEAYQEIHEGHERYGKKLQSLAKCDAKDEVLFRLKQENDDC